MSRGDKPAFQTFQMHNGVFTISGGMTLREYYAGLAMQGLLANGESPGYAGLAQREGFHESTAIIAVRMADALIAKLEEKK